MTNTRIPNIIDRLSKIAAPTGIKFSPMKVTRYNGQPHGSMDILDADGKVVGEILAEYDDPTWARRAERTYRWVVTGYEVLINTVEDADRTFPVAENTPARTVLAEAKAYARKVLSQ